MKHYTSIIIFVALIVSSAIASIGSYQATEREVLDNLNVALQQAIAKNKSTWLTQDTIANYRRMQGTMATPLAINIRDNTVCKYVGENLRHITFVEMQLVDKKYDASQSTNGYLCSDTIFWTDTQQNASIAIRSVAQCSMATIFAMSDQRVPAVLCLLAMVWAAFMFKKKKTMEMAVVCQQVSQSTIPTYPSIGGIVLRNDTFFDKDEQEIHLTPMQRKLLTMFFDSPDHKLLQSDICSSLWPKKDDASETLYALITRTKKAIESRCGIKIEVDRGRSYSLTLLK